MKVFVQIVNTKTNISQYGMIEEAVVKEWEIQNALKHFGVLYEEVIWRTIDIVKDVANSPKCLTGYVKGSDKLINIIAL